MLLSFLQNFFSHLLFLYKLLLVFHLLMYNRNKTFTFRRRITKFYSSLKKITNNHPVQWKTSFKWKEHKLDNPLGPWGKRTITVKCLTKRYIQGDWWSKDDWWFKVIDFLSWLTIQIDWWSKDDWWFKLINWHSISIVDPSQMTM